MPQLKNIVYKDIANSFGIHPITKKLSVLNNADSVKQSVKNIVLSNFYERPYKPNFGGNIYTQLFENMDEFTRIKLTQNIDRAIKNYEPRANLIEVRVNPVFDQNRIDISVTFSVKNLVEPIQVDISIERVR